MVVGSELDKQARSVVEHALARARSGHVFRDDFATLADQADLPARMFRAVTAALQQAGIEIVDRPAPEDPLGEDNPSEDAGGVDGFGDFVRRTQHRILTMDEEQALGRRIDSGRIAAAALAEAPEGLDEPGRRVIERRVRDGRAAEEELAVHNIRLVISLAKRAARHGGPALEFEDLVQEGYFGLVKAISKWEYQRGLKFSTYATWWIRQSLDRAVANKASAIRLPVHVHDQLRQITHAVRALERAGRPLDDRTVAERAELPLATVRQLRRLDVRVVSLDKSLASGDVTLGDFVARDRFDRPDRVADALARREVIEAVLGEIPERERQVLSMRFGIGYDGTRRTLEEVGVHFGVTRERVRQIEAKALKRLIGPPFVAKLRSLVVED